MADHRRSKKQDRQSRRDGVNRDVRFIGLSSAASTFITIGLSPLVHMPAAKADGEDIIIDQIINSLSAVDPTAALDMTSWLSSLDAALQGAANFDPSSLAGVMPDIDRRAWPARRQTSTPRCPRPRSADPAADPLPRHLLPICTASSICRITTWDQEWIAGTTFLGNLTVQWDNLLNGFWGDIGGQGDVDRQRRRWNRRLDPTGGAGGLWFGDGGVGWNSDRGR